MAATTTTTDIKRWGARDYLWLGLAIILHALLLLIPALKTGGTASAVVLNVTLLPPTPMEKPFMAEPEPQQGELPEIDNRPVRPDPQPDPQLTHREEPDERTEAEPPKKGPILTTARLLDLAGIMKWPAPEVDDSRQLGVFKPQAQPENWRSGIRLEDNLFNGLVLPRQTEIVDRWLAADGSHNVVINTPGGHTLCGRAVAWDPMQPLVEHVMQFRPCGGGGKRTFKMSQRLKRLTDNISFKPRREIEELIRGPLANSTTN